MLDQQPQPYMSVKQVADYLQLNEKKIYALVSEGGSTFCSGCGLRLIERDWYRLGEWRLDDEGCIQRPGYLVRAVAELVQDLVGVLSEHRRALADLARCEAANPFYRWDNG